MVKIVKNWEKLYLGNRAEVDSDIVLHCILGEVEFIQSGLGKYWAQGEFTWLPEVTL